MAKITSRTKLILENFPDQREWISPMFVVLNEFIQDVINTLNGGITFADNILGKEADADFVFINNTASLPKIKWDKVSPPRSLSVVAAYEAVSPGGGSPPRDFNPAILLVSWGLDSQNFITINDAVKVTSAGGVTGLTSQNRYRIRFRINP
jgi:hypothetical protein